MQTRYTNDPLLDEARKSLDYLQTRLALQALRLVCTSIVRRLEHKLCVPATRIIVDCPMQVDHMHPDAPCPLCESYERVPLRRWQAHINELIDSQIIDNRATPQTFDQSFSDDGIPL